VTPQLFFKAGTVIKDPDSPQAYRVTTDVFVGDVVRSEQFEPLNGAPVPRAGDPLPRWLEAVRVTPPKP
jgi:hypothetical protein